MTEKLHTLRSAAERLGCAPKTLENRCSSFRRALEAADAIVHFGRVVRVKESGLAAVAARGDAGQSAAA